MSIDVKAKKWMLTIAHSKNNMEHDIIKRLLNDFDNIIYWCMCDHEVDNIYHTHLFIAFATPVKFDLIVKNFPRAHIDIVHGTLLGSRSYIRKEGFYKKIFDNELVLFESFEESENLKY